MSQDYGRQLAGLIDPDRFPAPSATLASGVFEGEGEGEDEGEDEDWDVDVEFEGLDCILDGIGVLIDSRAR